MEEQSLLKKIFIKIKKLFLIIFLFIGGLIKSLFGIQKDTKKKSQIPNENIKNNEIKKETSITSNNTTLPDDDNKKTNPHNSNIDTEDTSNNQDVILELPKKKLYKIYNKDNELKYLTLEALLDLIIKEELERIYKEEKFKLKTATNSELKKVDEIKQNILPEIIIRVENETLRTTEIIRKEVVIKLEHELEKNPIFPPRPKVTLRENQEEHQNERTNIYTLAFPKKKELTIPQNKKQKIKKDSISSQITEKKKEEITIKVEATNVMMVQTINEVPKPTIKDNLKDAAVIGVIATAGVVTDILTTPEEDKQKETLIQSTENTENKKEEIPTYLEEIKEKERIEEPKIEEEKEQNSSFVEEILKEKDNIEEKEKSELEELKKQVEQKIEELKKEQDIQKETKKEPPKEQIDFKQDKEINDVAEVSENIIEETHTELKKEDFFDKDYDRIERQIDKMLEDITYTLLRYEGKLSEKQKRKLKVEESKLRATKEDIKTQKYYDIAAEQKHLDEDIKQSEIDGLENELLRIHHENEKEVSNELLSKMQKLEGMTAEQVANADKKIMLKKFNKANILLEMSSLLALPFVRNKYFFYFTVGLIIDNHFNFVNAFFNRKINRYEPADLSEIKKGQDALNGALDITYKNIVELEYLEQRALSKYPELSRDPKFINQVTKLKTNLNKKYNNLMHKNKTLEKYRMKTKKQIKTLKPQKKKTEQEAA